MKRLTRPRREQMLITPSEEHSDVTRGRKTQKHGAAGTFSPLRIL